VFIPDECYPWHPQLAKFQTKSNNPRPSYSDLTNSTWPPSAILDFPKKLSWKIQDKVRTPFSTYTPNLMKISRSASEICPCVSSCKISAKLYSWRLSYGILNNSKWPPSTVLKFQKSAPLRRNFTFGFTVDALRPLEHLYVSNFSQNLVKISQSAAEICPPKRNSKNRPGSRILLPVSTLTPPFFGDLCMCHHAKFQTNRTCCRVITILVIQDGRRPPSWIFEENVFGPFYTLRDLIFYITPKLMKIYRSVAEICCQKKFEKRPLVAELYFRFHR